MRVLHTSDWHLGHRLFTRSRIYEHQHFLSWLLDRMQRDEVDALLIAGDIFDTANPPAQALALWYGFLAACSQRLPGLQIVAIGGNHDSAARLDAPAQLLRALKVRVVGGARRDGRLRSPEEMIFPLERRGQGNTRAWVAAVPFLRPMDLPALDLAEGQDPLVEGMRAYYEAVLAELEKLASPEDLRLAMGHLYLRKGQLSEWSERKILGGNQHAIPADIFPEWLDYVALGHLHRPQAIGRDDIRYCGSPIPLAMDERHYPHQVNLLLCKEPGAALEIHEIRVPRSVPLIRVPDKGSLPVGELLDALKEQLPQRELGATIPAEFEMLDSVALEPSYPFVELAARLEAPDPELRDKLEQACEAKEQFLSSLVVEYAGAETSLGEAQQEQDLRQLAPEEVLKIMHESRYGEAIEPLLLETFAELIDSLGQDEQSGTV